MDENGSELPRTYEQALKHAETLAEKGNHWAIAFLKCGHKTKTGERPHKLLDTPWCNGAVWSINSMPGFPGEISHFKLQWNEKIIDSLYGPNAKGNLDGEYVDSSEGYATAVMDYDREHFAVAQTPLTFDTSDKAPGIHKGLISFEYIRKLEQDVRKMGKLMMANSTPGQYCGCTLLDVMARSGTGTVAEMESADDHAMLYRRILRDQTLQHPQNTNFDEFSTMLRTLHETMPLCILSSYLALTHQPITTSEILPPTIVIDPSSKSTSRSASWRAGQAGADNPCKTSKPEEI